MSWCGYCYCHCMLHLHIMYCVYKFIYLYFNRELIILLFLIRCPLNAYNDSQRTAHIWIELQNKIQYDCEHRVRRLRGTRYLSNVPHTTYPVPTVWAVNIHSVDANDVWLYECVKRMRYETSRCRLHSYNTISTLSMKCVRAIPALAGKRSCAIFEAYVRTFTSAYVCASTEYIRIHLLAQSSYL